jgi:hypothetical protein
VGKRQKRRILPHDLLLLAPRRRRYYPRPNFSAQDAAPTAGEAAGGSLLHR